MPTQGESDDRDELESLGLCSLAEAPLPIALVRCQGSIPCFRLSGVGVARIMAGCVGAKKDERSVVMVG